MLGLPESPFKGKAEIGRAMRFGVKGIHLSPETEFKKGQSSPAKGIKRPDLVERNKSSEQRAAVSKARRGRVMPPEFGRKISIAKKGKSVVQPPRSEQAKRNMSEVRKGKHYSLKTEFKKGCKGKPISTELREKINEGIRKGYANGRVPWNKGIKWEQPWWKDPQFAQKVSLERSKRWENPEYRAKVMQAWLKQRRPTGPERKLIQIIKKYRLPFKYTGDGSFLIGRLNPDFVEINGRKLAIDIFGDYWHTLKADKDSYTEEGRKEIFNEYGWEDIIIWEHDINSLPDDKIVEMIGGKHETT